MARINNSLIVYDLPSNRSFMHGFYQVLGGASSQ
jgi:hypothetical protein